eukprot:30864-Pelagococcus_subviridis.AAC.17
MKFTTPTRSYGDRRETERALTIHADSANVNTELDVLTARGSRAARSRTPPSPSPPPRRCAPRRSRPSSTQGRSIQANVGVELKGCIERTSSPAPFASSPPSSPSSSYASSTRLHASSPPPRYPPCARAFPPPSPLPLVPLPRVSPPPPLRVVPYERLSGWSRKASDGVERRRGRGLKARDPGRRDAPGKVLKDRRSPRQRDRMGTSV